MKTCKRLSDPDAIKLQVEGTSELSEVEITLMVEIFNQYGCVILACSSSGNLRQNLLGLKYYFGQIIPHRSSDSDGVVLIKPTPGANYTALTGQPFAFHTDGSFMSVPPKVVALQCEVAVETGGVSQLVQGEILYRFLRSQDPKGLEALFEPDAVVVRTRDGEVYTGSVFTRSGERIKISSYRPSDRQVTVQTKPDALGAYNLIEYFVKSGIFDEFQYQLQPGEILVMDNTRILHTRTPFDEKKGAKRRLYRLWMDGQPNHTRLDYGFSCSEKHTFSKN